MVAGPKKVTGECRQLHDEGIQDLFSKNNSE
jgi:hypothetical protein